MKIKFLVAGFIALAGADSTCPTGLKGDGKTCEDIDECKDGVHNCDNTKVCENLWATFDCIECQNGTIADGFACKDIDECDTNQHDCTTNQTCENIWGRFTCEDILTTTPETTTTQTTETTQTTTTTETTIKTETTATTATTETTLTTETTSTTTTTLTNETISTTETTSTTVTTQTAATTPINETISTTDTTTINAINTSTTCQCTCPTENNKFKAEVVAVTSSTARPGVTIPEITSNSIMTKHDFENYSVVSFRTTSDMATKLIVI